MKDQYILVLEDNPQRHAIFRKNFADGNHLVIVETAKEAIALLDNERWDFLFLDHDLGGQIMVPSGPDTGYEVALWLEAHVNKNPDNIIIHSPQYNWFCKDACCHQRILLALGRLDAYRPHLELGNS